jgi:hypothetical protein
VPRNASHTTARFSAAWQQLKLNSMDNYLFTIGCWNFAGSIMMLGFVHEPFGQKVLNEWTLMFNDKFVLDYWGRLWCFWAAGLNVFFGLVNMMSVKWGYEDVKIFLVWFDIVAYLIFLGLLIWGIKANRIGFGGRIALVVFVFWVVWGFWVVA